MITLTDLLNELLESLAWHGEPVEYLQNGLSLPEIERLVSRLPYQLPQEVYELYQWRNGTFSDADFLHTVNFRPYYRLIPLGEAVNYTLALLVSQQNVAQYRAKHPSVVFSAPHGVDRLFPILALEDRCFCSVQGSITLPKPTAVVYDDLLDSVPYPIATSLTGFFQSLLECWNTGVYAVNPLPCAEWDIYDTFVINEQEEKRIFAKNREAILP